MLIHRYREGDHVKARSMIYRVPHGTRGIVTQCYASIWDLYEVQFETSAEPRVVWGEELEADGPAGVHEPQPWRLA